MAGAICTLFVGVVTAVSRSDPISREGLSLKTALVVPLTVASLASFWEYQVTKNVPEPYLDEVFHIPQAQAYCRWEYATWDPKLTTPPGLYWWSHFLSIVSGFTTCNAHFLRITNVIALVSIIMLAWKCRALIFRAGNEDPRDQNPRLFSADALHTAVNIALFPPLFFFAGLYYTDVLSTCVVLYLYKQFLEQGESTKKTWIDGIWFYFCGILALCMRQTNIFWAAVLLGGMDAVRTMKETYNLRSISLNHPPAPFQAECLSRFYEVIQSKYLHDPPLNEAYLEDLLLTPVSMLQHATINLPTVLLHLIPHISLLITFAAFVYINGGVVLGDKSNHVATIHLPQLLYLWPFIAFFSFPLLLPALFSLLFSIIDNTIHPSNFLTSSLSSQLRVLISFSLLLACSLGSLIIIKYNTIIHPFTLADNRHYVFYVFRYTILRHPLIRYLLAPIYTGCFFLTLKALAGSSFLSAKPNESKDKDHESKADHDAKTPSSSTSSPHPTNPLSTLLLLLLTTALSLITAPLVEPRYYILPFIFLRLHIPTLSTNSCSRPDPDSPESPEASPSSNSRQINLPLYLESLWYLLINATTGYIFLYRGFSWPQEPGRVQRFMW